MDAYGDPVYKRFLSLHVVSLDEYSKPDIIFKTFISAIFSSFDS